MADIKDLWKKTQQSIRELTKKVQQELQLGREEKAEAQEKAALRTKEQKTPTQTLRLVLPSTSIAKAILVLFGLLLLLGFLYLIRDIIVIFFVSILFAAALDPMVDALERRKIPRPLGVIIIYVVVFFVLGLFIGHLVPLLAKEIADLAGKAQVFITNLVTGEIALPEFLQGLRTYIKDLFEGVDISKLGDYSFLEKFSAQLGAFAGNVFNFVIAIFNGLFNAILVMVLTFLMVVDERGVDKFILSLFPARHAEYITGKSAAIKEKVGQWLRGQIILSLIVGFLVYIGYVIIGLFTGHIEFSLTLALLAGLTEMIPYIGPVIAWLITVPIVANQSVTLVLWVTVVFVIVQQLENNFIVPLVMKKAVGLSPIFVMFAMLAGYALGSAYSGVPGGVLGIVLSVPVATTVAIFVQDYAAKEK